MNFLKICNENENLMKNKKVNRILLVNRMRYISSQLERAIRILALSSSLGNCKVSRSSFLEAQLLSNYIDVTDSHRHSFDV